MTLQFPILYHWAPRTLRESILREGLRVMSPGPPCRDPETRETVQPAYPWICLGTTPSCAWGFILDPDAERAEAGWDLWQVRLAETDRVHIRTDLMPYIQEVRVENSIPADRVWWVGVRHRWPHEPDPEPAEER